MSKTLNANQTRAVSLLAAGMTKTQCAAEVKVSRETLNQWSKIPEFANQLHQLQQEQAKQSFNRALTMCDDALDTIFDMMINPETPPNIKLNAASRILEFGKKVFEDLDMEHRMVQIEVKLGIREGSSE
jgi:orotate phosphoribosyltransferase-like protein